MKRTTRDRQPQHSHRAQRDGLTSTRQPRPAPRRQGTRAGQIRAAVREG